jgi:hypothetical protein
LNLTPQQYQKITRAIGKELKPLWKTQIFIQADQAAQYLVTEAIARALVKLQNEE